MLGVDPGVLDSDQDGLLLAPAGAEVLRRFNERLRERTGALYDDPELREAVVDSYFVDPAFGPAQGGAQPTLPGVEAWFEAVRALAGRLDLVGDLDDSSQALLESATPTTGTCWPSGCGTGLGSSRRSNGASTERWRSRRRPPGGDTAGDTAGGNGG